MVKPRWRVESEFVRVPNSRSHEAGRHRAYPRDLSRATQVAPEVPQGLQSGHHPTELQNEGGRESAERSVVDRLSYA